jgi:DNA (cytosine-5)-methyltransferase 1
MSARPIIVDSFAGGGGASLGILMGLGSAPEVAINHDAKRYGFPERIGAEQP